MKRLPLISLAAPLLSSLLLVACTKTEPPEKTEQQAAASTNAPAPPASASGIAPNSPLPAAGQLLARIADNAIIPLYRELLATSEQLAQQSAALCQNPSAAQLQAVRTAWGETLMAWHRTDALLFGPAISDQLDYAIAFNPPKKAIINGILDGGDPITPESLDHAGVGGQGLYTLEFLLFDRDKGDAEQLAALQDPTGSRRCAYIQAASALLRDNVRKIAEPWVQDSNGYATAFRSADKGNATFANAREAVDLLVGKLHQSAEKLSKTRIGDALGKGININSEGRQEILLEANAYQLEAWRSGYSIRVVRANVEGIRRILKDGGILDWLREHNPGNIGQFLADTLERRLDNYLQLPEPSTDPFELVRTGRGEELDGYYYLGNDILMGIRRQLARVMGVQLGFNDNDGD